MTTGQTISDDLLINHVEPVTPSRVFVCCSDQAPEVDRHPERRLKAAYAAYEEERLPQLKAEHPNMRLSQLKQLLWKEWLKAKPALPPRAAHVKR